MPLTSGFRQKFSYVILKIPNIIHLLQPLKNVIWQEFITSLLEWRTCNGKERQLLSLPVKACVRYFLSNLYFFTKWWPFKTYEKSFFLFHLKSSFCSWDSNFYNFFPSFPHFPDLKGQMEVEWFMMSWIGLHKFADVIFGITQKLHH